MYSHDRLLRADFDQTFARYSRVDNYFAKQNIQESDSEFKKCCAFNFFLNQAAVGDGGEKRVTATDPSHQEEAVMNGKLVLGVNPYREICTLHLAGQILIEKVRCSFLYVDQYQRNILLSYLVFEYMQCMKICSIAHMHSCFISIEHMEL